MKKSVFLKKFEKPAPNLVVHFKLKRSYTEVSYHNVDEISIHSRAPSTGSKGNRKGHSLNDSVFPGSSNNLEKYLNWRNDNVAGTFKV